MRPGCVVKPPAQAVQFSGRHELHPGGLCMCMRGGSTAAKMAAVAYEIVAFGPRSATMIARSWSLLNSLGTSKKYKMAAVAFEIVAFGPRSAAMIARSWSLLNSLGTLKKTAPTPGAGWSWHGQKGLVLNLHRDICVQPPIGLFLLAFSLHTWETHTYTCKRPMSAHAAARYLLL